MGLAVLTLEAANMFCGTDPTSSSGVTASNHLTLSEVMLPSLEEAYVDHRAGGSPVAIEIDTGVNKLQSTFNLIGWTPAIAGLFASWQSVDNQFFIYGVLRDQSTGLAQQAKAKITGRLGRAAPQNWRRGDVQHWDYSIRGITYYQLWVGNPLVQQVLFNFFGSTFIVGNNDLNSDLNTLLMTGVTTNSTSATPLEAAALAAGAPG